MTRFLKALLAIALLVFLVPFLLAAFLYIMLLFE